MKKLKNNTVIIGVDHGYGNIKTANTITPAAVTSYDTEPVFTGSILKYNGTYYRIGEGQKEFVSDKTGDDDYYILTLMAIARELEYQGIREADVYLAAGLPITWTGRQRNSFRAYLMRHPEVTYEYNGKEYHIRLTGCSIFPQSYPAVITRVDEFSGITLLADIGSGTLNILYFNGQKPLENRMWTEKLGVRQCMIAARNAVMDSFGIKIDPSIIEQIIRTGTSDIPGEYLDVISAVCRSYCRDIFDALRRYEYNPDLMHLYIIGGGGSLIRHFADYDKSRVTIIEDLSATAKGYEALAYNVICRKERT